MISDWKLSHRLLICPCLMIGSSTMHFIVWCLLPRVWNEAKWNKSSNKKLQTMEYEPGQQYNEFSPSTLLKGCKSATCMHRLMLRCQHFPKHTDFFHKASISVTGPKIPIWRRATNLEGWGATHAFSNRHECDTAPRHIWRRLLTAKFVLPMHTDTLLINWLIIEQNHNCGIFGFQTQSPDNRVNPETSSFIFFLEIKFHGEWPTSCFSGRSFSSCFNTSTSNLERSPFWIISTNSSLELFKKVRRTNMMIWWLKKMNTLTDRSPAVLVSLPFELFEKYIQIQILLGINKGNLQARKEFVTGSFITFITVTRISAIQT